MLKSNTSIECNVNPRSYFNSVIFKGIKTEKKSVYIYLFKKGRLIEKNSSS